MNAQGAALVLVRRATTWGAVVELPPKPKGFPCVNAQVDKSRFPDVDAPLLEGQLEDTLTKVASATRPYAKVLWGDLSEINDELTFLQ